MKMCEENLCRPGGYALTERLSRWIKEPENGILVDVGCGSGDSLRYLHGRYPGLELWGIDPGIQDMDDTYIYRKKGTATALPFENHRVDTVLMECTFSRLLEPEASLAEILRVLKPGGRVLISDLYLRQPGVRQPGVRHQSVNDEVRQRQTGAWHESVNRQSGAWHQNVNPLEEVNNRLGRLMSAEQIQQELKDAGFHLLYMQDTSRVLGDWVAQKIMDDQGADIQEQLGMSWQELRHYKLGYFLAVAEVSTLPELVNYAREHSEFYKEAFEDCGHIRNETGDLQRLPFTRGEDLRQHPDRLLCVSPKEIARIITLKSTGSTGAPKRICFTEEDLERTADFFDRGIRYLVETGYRVAVFMEGPTHYSVGGLLKEGLSRLQAEVKVCGLIRDYDQAGRDAENMDTLIGVPFQLYRLAKLFPHLRPRTVLLSADAIADSLKRTIEDIWQCRVFTHWGMSETGYGGGVQCSCREGYHLRDDDLLAEILDPDTNGPCFPGTYGELVVTTLHRRGMPLIRYRTGDIARLIPGKCPCGSLLPRLDRILGRKGGSLMLPGGRELWLGELDEIMYALPILSYQSEWRQEDKTMILYVEWEKEEESSCIQLCDRMEEYFGDSLKIRILPFRDRTTMETYNRGKKMILRGHLQERKDKK